MPTDLQLSWDAPWKQRYRLPVTYGLQIAKANPTRGIALSTISGVEQLYAWDVPTGALRQLTTRPEGVGNSGDSIPNCILSPDGNYLYYLNDEHGNETGHFVRVPFMGGAAEDITPNLPPYTSFLLCFSRNGRTLGFTALADGVYTIYRLSVEPDGKMGEPVILYQDTQQTLGPILSYDGEIAVIETKIPNTSVYTLVALNGNTGQEISRLGEPDGGLEIYLSSPLPGDLRFMATASDTSFERPFLWNPTTGEITQLALDDIPGDLVPVDWHIDATGTSSILLRQNVQVEQRLYVYDVNSQNVQALATHSGTFGTTEPGSIFFGPDGEIFSIWESSTQPRQLIALDSATGTEQRVVLGPDAVQQGHAWTSVRFPSSDGEMVQAWLALPDGNGPFPTIIEVHGGPQFAVLDMFSPASQSWLDHGFAYLSVNYRGSAFFGTGFQEKIYGDLGHWEVEDIAAARQWLVQQGIAIPAQVFLTGWSYGGYLTLQTLGKYPGLWAGGMAGIAIADLAMNDEDGSILQSFQRGLMGGTPEEKPDQYRASSPITYVEQVDAPVLIIQGLNDVRCTRRQIEVYEQRMKALGKPIEVYWFDAGHGSVPIEEQIAHQELMLHFVYRVLGLE